MGNYANGGFVTFTDPPPATYVSAVRPLSSLSFEPRTGANSKRQFQKSLVMPIPVSVTGFTNKAGSHSHVS
eukprot:7526434-Pyramimonas_sp.AAC.1